MKTPDSTVQPSKEADQPKIPEELQDIEIETEKREVDAFEESRAFHSENRNLAEQSKQQEYFTLLVPKMQLSGETHVSVKNFTFGELNFKKKLPGEAQHSELIGAVSFPSGSSTVTMGT